MLVVLLGLMFNAYYYAVQDIAEKKMVTECLTNHTCYQIPKGEGKDRYYEILFYGVEYERYGVRFSGPEQEKQIMEAKRKEYSEKYPCFKEQTCDLNYANNRIRLVPTDLSRECICHKSCYVDEDSGKVVHGEEKPFNGSYMVFENVVCTNSN